MSRVIPDAIQGVFHPLVGLRTLGNFVKGKVMEMGKTAADNPYIVLSVIDLDGTTSKAISKGQYQEVDINIGDLVQVIGSVKQLKEKLPQLAIGDITTITYVENRKVPKGTMKVFKVEVE